MIQSQYESLLKQIETANQHMGELVQLLDKSWINRLFEPTTIIAIIVALFAFMQWYTSEKQRKQDIFEKRWELYSRVFGLFYQQQVLKQRIDVKNLLPYANEANFLFDKAVAKHIMGLGAFRGKDLDYDWFNKPFKRYMRIK